MIELLVAAALSSVAPDGEDLTRDQKIEELWQRGAGFLEPAGITRPMFRQINYWTELQYVLGYCTTHLKADDVRYWSTWWEDTPLPRSEVGRMLLTKGSEVYESGLEAGRKEQPSLELCQRSADDWFADMKRVVDEGKAEGARP